MHRSVLIGMVLLLLAAAVPGALRAATEPATEVRAPNGASLRQVSGKIERAVLEILQAGESTRALIVMAEQADVSAAQNLPSKQAKGRFVFETLRATAARTQAGVIAALEQQGLAYRAYYVANVIAVEDLGAAEAAVIAARPEVGRIEGNPDVHFDEPVSRTIAGEAARGVEWGIQKIRADDLWAMGIKGKGIVVANQDTGVQWDHPALKTHYRGFDKKTGKAVHSYSWWDAIHKSIAGGAGPCGFNLKKPCDDDGHGTHTLGTIVGGVGANKIGVAPKSRWISCRSMDRGVGRPNTYIECFEFFLAPWNKGHNNPDPNLAPDVISNSWGCVLGAPPGGEGCMPNSIKTATENIRAAGIFVAVSAGNTGSSCSTVTDPSAIYDAATTVGATNSIDALASFSSRGPVTVDLSNRRKPDISAPGENVRSAYPPNSYAALSGTSMAAPHVAGAVALLWQGRPSLRGDVDATEAALFNTARTKVSVSGTQSCGGTGPDAIPNNLFGYGRLDVFKAYQSAQ